MTTRQASTARRAGISADQAKKNLLRLKNRMRGLRNQMDYIEILSNFWPLPNMEARIRRLELEMCHLNQAYSDGVRQLREQLGLNAPRQAAR
ncbi:MAG: hypothetical protein AB7P76_04020 [Candidatus Melainabacteria bacterium]